MGPERSRARVFAAQRTLDGADRPATVSAGKKGDRRTLRSKNRSDPMLFPKAFSRSHFWLLLSPPFHPHSR
jgi:hypothetical protein